jgi:hypothetical protein
VYTSYGATIFTYKGNQLNHTRSMSQSDPEVRHSRPQQYCQSNSENVQTFLFSEFSRNNNNNNNLVLYFNVLTQQLQERITVITGKQ